MPAVPASPEMLALIERLASLDASERLEAIQGLRRYAGHRKVTQAVFEHRNDGDRRIREIARQILDEAERKTSESLSVAGAVDDERETRIDELIAELHVNTPFERISALKQLKFFMPHPKIEAELVRMKKDPDRAVRLLVQQIFDDRKEAEVRGDRITANEIRDGVLVASPYSKKTKKAWKESTADRLGPELIPYFGMMYLAIGLPLMLVVLWIWADVYGVIDPTVAPDPSLKNFVHEILRVPLDPLSLALAFALFALPAVGGLGTMLKHEWGRRCVLLFHALLTFWGLFYPNVWFKLAPFGLSTIVLYYLTRREIVAVFKGNDESKKGPPPPANYGDMERKVW